MGIKGIITFLLIGTAYYHWGPYQEYNAAQAEDMQIVGSTMFTNNDFEFDNSSALPYVPLRLPTAPSTKIVHNGYIPTSDLDIEGYTQMLLYRAKDSVDFTTGLTNRAIDYGCVEAHLNEYRMPTCNQDFILETDTTVYEATLTVNEVREGRFRTELMLNPIRSSE